MSATTFAFVALVSAVSLVGAIVWQWRTGELIDPIFSLFASEGWKWPLMWLTTAIYGSVALAAVVVAFQIALGD